jgi:hypothetical protein
MTYVHAGCIGQRAADVLSSKRCLNQLPLLRSGWGPGSASNGLDRQPISFKRSPIAGLPDALNHDSLKIWH